MTAITKLTKTLVGAAALTVVCTGFASCSSDDDAPTPPTCTVALDEDATSMSTAGFTVTFDHADSVKYVFYPDDTPTLPTIEDIRANGIKLDVAQKSQKVVVSGLAEDTQYTFLVVAFGEKSLFMSGACGTKTSAFPGVTFTTASATVYGNRNASVELASADGVKLNLDVYYEQFKYMRPGKYEILESTPTTGDVPQYILGGANNARYTSLTAADGTSYALTGGTVDVSVDTEAKTYTMAISAKLSEGETVEARFTGAIEGIDVFDEYTLNMDAAKLVDVNDRKDGEFYLKLNDNDWNAEMTLDFQCAAGTKALQAGTYTVSADGGAGTLSTRSSIDAYSIPAQGGYFESGQAVVEVSGSNYTIKWDLTTKEGQRFVGEFKGEVSDM